MVAVSRVVIHQRKVESEGKLVDLAIATRYHADVLEALFLEVLNKKPQDALMIGSDVQEVFRILVLLVSFKFVNNLLGDWIQSNKADMVDVFATL